MYKTVFIKEIIERNGCRSSWLSLLPS